MSNQCKVVLITGGSSGIGLSTAIEFAKLGYKLAIVGLDKTELTSAHNDIVSAFPPNNQQKSDDYLLDVLADFLDDAQVDNVVSTVVTKYGRLDILINNAGCVGNSYDLFHDGFFQDFQNVLQVNLLASTRIAQLAAPYLIQSRGVIINTSSIADRLPLRNIAYCVSKAGLTMLTKTLANSFEGKGVRVLAVAPGPIKTKINTELLEEMSKKTTLMQRVGRSHEVANLIVFLASDKASYMTGSTIDIDGGQLCKLGLMALDEPNKLIR